MTRQLTTAAEVLIGSSMATSTLEAYRADWASFTDWCSATGEPPLPADPAVVANYLADQANDYAASTIGRRLAAINKVHQLQNYTAPGGHPAVKAVLEGIRRTVGRRPRRMRPILADDLQHTVSTLEISGSVPASVSARRDACLLVFGYAGAFRRSELAALQLKNIHWHPADGLHVMVTRSKTDQYGFGQIKALPYGRLPTTCPVCVLYRWLDVLEATLSGRPVPTGSNEGHVCRGQHPALVAHPTQWLFPPVNRHGRVFTDHPMSGQAVNAMVQRRLAGAGTDPSGYGSHSMRAGFVTQALRNGATDAQVMRQTGHRSPATVHIYDRENNPLVGNAVTNVGF